ncbi:hypothetical protein ASPBRDRAFT_27691 [Aspergillus brasiliensis CBS 101740]|uniref:Uncharacterized protein n=1 Tax=Aspergillus brasiliensis (strain CBS 101740 / IMI 381727 / IBT 21946) TaxID=767769 RepID=A0A1L9UST1_ASPBC|nr:hypothetical protein ASPBRDRAFT_27691 [Aspergillus brasiliensis CBS 101740]
MDVEIGYASQNPELSSKEEGNSSEFDDSVEGVTLQRLRNGARRHWDQAACANKIFGCNGSPRHLSMLIATRRRSKIWQETSKLLQRMGDIDLERHGEVLVRLASLARDEDQALQYLKKALELSANNKTITTYVSQLQKGAGRPGF